MAVQTFNSGGMWVPRIYSSTGLGSAVLVMNAAGLKTAWVLVADKAKTINSFEMLFGLVTTAADLKFSIQGVDSSGNPDGVIADSLVLAAASQVTNTWTNIGTFATGLAVTPGQRFAIVAEWNSTAGNLQITHANDNSSFNGLNYYDFFNVSWSKKTANLPVCAVKYSDGTYANLPGTYACTTLSSPNFNSGSSPNEKGLIFQFPGPVQVDGVWFSLTGASSTANLNFYDSDGTTQLASIAVAGATESQFINFMYFSPISLLANTNYRVTLQPTSGSNIANTEMTLNASALQKCFDGGSNFMRTSRTGAGAWTNTNTIIPFFGLHVIGISDGVGGGGATSYVF